MRKQKHILYGILVAFFLLLLLYVVLIFTLEPKNKVWRPEQGVWYCEELHMQLSFEKGYKSYVILDGEAILCACENDRGSKNLLVLCQEPNVKGYEIGDPIFSGRYVDLNNNKYTVKDNDSHELYTFVLMALSTEST